MSNTDENQQKIDKKLKDKNPCSNNPCFVPNNRAKAYNLLNGTNFYDDETLKRFLNNQ